ncbi:MAG TPA: prepilin-type N-terminal cleavage/methylation domain-containing protein [Tissierellia bacterium]|jgi:prepilin-type N-terminal cleavage/methylation domain-containing protein|nr:prepilin-type N-terminal cleavage/methylation domain-containing protein [Tissierellia bacterium]
MSNKGFTLIELILTISILLIVLTIVVPVLNRDMFYMEKMANEFITDVRYVQMECMKNPYATYRISINKDEGCYHVLNNTVKEKTVEFKSRYKIDYTNINMQSIGFTYEGIPLNAGTFRIIDTRTNEIIEVSIVPTTGRTVIKE